MKFSACGVGDVSQSYLERPLHLVIVCNGRVFETEYCPENRDGWQNSTWEDLGKFVQQITSTVPVSITYEDEENEKITFSSDAEWFEAMKVAVLDGYSICLTVSGEPVEDDGKKISNIEMPSLSEENHLDFVPDLEDVVDESHRGAANSTRASSSHASDTQPPAWFETYMAKFKDDLAEEISYTVCSKLMRKVTKDSSVQNCMMCPTRILPVCNNCAPEYNTFWDEPASKSPTNEMVQAGKHSSCSSATYDQDRELEVEPLIPKERDQGSEVERELLNRDQATRTVHDWTTASKLKTAMNSEFLYDETVPDSAKFLPGSSFVKTWRVVNTGKEQWNKDTKLKFLWGSKGFTPRVTLVDVSPLMPGEIGSVSVPYDAPDRAGHYESHWNFIHQGQLFGHRVWCVIEVVDPLFCSSNYHRKLAHKAVLEQEPESGERQAPPEAASGGDEQENADLPAPEASSNVLLTPSETSDKLEYISNPDSDDDYDFNLSGRNSITESDLASVLSVGSADNSLDYVVVPMPACFIIPADLTLDKEIGAIDSRPAVVKGNANSSSSSVVFIASDGEESVPGTAPSECPSMNVTNSEIYAEGSPTNKTDTTKKVDVDVVANSTNTTDSVCDGDSNVDLVHRKRSAETGERVAEQMSSGEFFFRGYRSQNDECPTAVVAPSVDVGVQVSVGEENTQNERPDVAEHFYNSATSPKPNDEDVADQMVHVLPEGLVNAAASVYNSAKSALTAFQNVASGAASGNSKADKSQQGIAPGDACADAANLATKDSSKSNKTQPCIVTGSPDHTAKRLPPVKTNSRFEPSDAEVDVVLIKFRDMGIYVHSETVKVLLVKHNSNLQEIINEVLNLHVDNDWSNHRH